MTAWNGPELLKIQLVKEKKHVHSFYQTVILVFIKKWWQSYSVWLKWFHTMHWAGNKQWCLQVPDSIGCVSGSTDTVHDSGSSVSNSISSSYSITNSSLMLSPGASKVSYKVYCTVGTKKKVPDSTSSVSFKRHSGCFSKQCVQFYILRPFICQLFL